MATHRRDVDKVVHRVVGTMVADLRPEEQIRGTRIYILGGTINDACMNQTPEIVASHGDTPTGR